VTVHVIGAGLAEATGASQKFFEISNLIPNIEKLHLVLIGPYLKGMTTGGERIKAEKWGTSHCEVSFTYRDELYHDWARRDPNWALPTLAIAQNCGIHDRQFKEQWRETALLLIEKEVPFAATGLTSEDTAGDLETLGEWGGGVILPTQKNPFRSLRPLVDGIVSTKEGVASAGFFFNNCYLCMIRGKVPAT
jgi:hypothetical protein